MPGLSVDKHSLVAFVSLVPIISEVPVIMEERKEKPGNTAEIRGRWGTSFLSLRHRASVWLYQ